MTGRGRGARCGSLLVAGALWFALLSSSAMAAGTVVGTQYGELQGQVAGNVRSFLGIPYAAPPVGNLRWRSPQPPASWTGVRDATYVGPRCAQPAGKRNPEGSVSEDCLYLNVYAPSTGTSNLPVMVWIHGAGWVAGAGSDYDPSELVSRENVIVVTINYRLGALGWLALPGFADENRFHSTGNYGFQDQQQALRWVKANIDAFGGDPGNVTLAGESAGAFSICDHLAAPDSKGLFQKAVIQSAPCSSAIAAIAGSDARTRSVRYAAKPALGCSGAAAAVVACMRSKSVEQILSAEIPNAGSDASVISALGWFPNVDGHYLPTRPRVAIAAGLSRGIPVLIGTNHDEGNLVPLADYDVVGKPLNAGNYTAELANQFGTFLPIGSQIPAALTSLVYPPRNYPAPGYDASVAPAHLALGAFYTDLGFACFTQNTAGLMTTAGQPTYRFEFSDPNPPTIIPSPLFPLRAYHSSEIQFMLGRQVFSSTAYAGMTAAQVTLAQRMMEYWANFARTGNPNGPGLPTWPRYGSLPRRIMRLTSGSGLGPFAATAFGSDHKCALWGPTDIILPGVLTLLDALPKFGSTAAGQ